MEFINKLLPTLWAIVEKQKCAINVSALENKLTVNILWGKKRKTFCDKNHDVLLQKLQHYLVI